MRTPPHVVAFRIVTVATHRADPARRRAWLGRPRPGERAARLVNSGVNSGQAAYTTGTGS